MVIMVAAVKVAVAVIVHGINLPNGNFLIIMSILCCVMFAYVLMLSTSLDSYTHACGRVEQWWANVAKASAAASAAAANCTKA
jgi:hypothetical protein